MSPVPGRPKPGERLLGGQARNAPLGAVMSPVPGRPKPGERPLGGQARNAPWGQS